MLIGWMPGSRAAVVLASATALIVGSLPWLHLTGHVFSVPVPPIIFATAVIWLVVIAATLGSLAAAIYKKQLAQLMSMHDQLLQDFTKRKEYERRLEHIAQFDVLTNLPNRVLFASRLQQAMSEAQQRGQRLAVAYLDLDGFKAVNDHHGHDVGDQLLITLCNAMNDTMPEGDTLSRIGGDEFVAVLNDMDNPASCAPMLTRLLEAAALSNTGLTRMTRWTATCSGMTKATCPARTSVLILAWQLRQHWSVTGAPAILRRGLPSRTAQETARSCDWHRFRSITSIPRNWPFR